MFCSNFTHYAAFLIYCKMVMIPDGPAGFLLWAQAHSVYATVKTISKHYNETMSGLL